MNDNFRQLKRGNFPLVLLMLLMMSWHADAGEEQLPLWELGIGGGVFSLPKYMGSDERYTYPFAFPYLIYRGERWRLNRTGVSNRIFDSDRFSLDVSLSGGLPVKNSNRARQGMPELFLTGELGPQVNWLLAESDSDSWSLHLPSRAAINIRGKYVGWVTDPYLRYQYHTPVEQGLLRIKLDAGVLYGSRRYHETYYGVDPVYATATRPTYRAKAGLHSLYVKAVTRYPLNEKLEIFTSAQLRTLAVGAVKDSPLVRQSSYASVALGLVWVFDESDEKVMREEWGTK